MKTFTASIIPNFVFREQIKAYYIGANVAYDSLIRSIYAHYMDRPSFTEALQGFIDVCDTLNSIVINTGRRPMAADRMGHLIANLAAKMGRQRIFAQTEIDFLRDTCKALETDNANGWYMPKLHALKNYAVSSNGGRQLAESMALRGAMSKLVAQPDGAETDDMFKMTRDLIGELLRLRKYGIKPCYFEDGLFHQRGQAWAFMDFGEIRNLMSPSRNWFQHDPLAFIGLARVENLKRIGMETVSIRSGEGKMNVLTPTFDGNCYMTLDSRGELDLSHGCGFLPVRGFFEERGNIFAYECLRLVQVMRLYDLVVPLETVKSMPETETRGMIGKLKMIAGILKHKKPFWDLVLPRLHALEDEGKITSQIEKEIEEAERETAARSSRELHKHEVICHVRKLPNGKHATDLARERAATSGITLQDGETFVKTHTRGKIEGPELPHRAKVHG